MAEQTKTFNELLTREELGQFLRISERLVDNLVKEGRIKGIKLGKKKVFFLRDQVIKQLTENS